MVLNRNGISGLWTVVNFESQFFSPRMSGITYYVDTLMFTADTAFQPLSSPLELVVVGA